MFFNENGFETEIQYREHSEVRKGTVVRQFPEPGYILRDGDSVHLEVAL
jgi:beta-lactam-binding protein with PASTA domain